MMTVARCRKGYTFIELILAVLITAIMAITAFPCESSNDLETFAAMKAICQEFRSAASRAAALSEPIQITVDPDGGRNGLGMITFNRGATVIEQLQLAQFGNVAILNTNPAVDLIGWVSSGSDFIATIGPNGYIPGVLVNVPNGQWFEAGTIDPRLCLTLSVVGIRGAQSDLVLWRDAGSVQC